MTQKKLLVASFSGGKTSGYMTRQLLAGYRDQYDIVVLFANTGQENEETLEFIKKCDEEFGFGTIWLEAVVNHGQRKASGHKVVDFETATRDRSLFEEMIKKYGIPNKSYPHCTRELKENPIISFLQSKEIYSPRWKAGNYETALGMRIDEPRRLKRGKHRQNRVYPLADWFPTDKTDVNIFWEEQPFTLELAEHRGNCKWCWKKTLTKHLRLIKETPEIYDVPRYFEENYPHAGHNDGERKRVFFRENRSTDDLFKLAEELAFEEGRQLGLDYDLDAGCGESCEPFAD